MLALAALAALVSCGGGGGSRDPAGPGDGGQLAVTCSLSASSVPAGSPTGATVTAVVTRNGSPAGGQTIVFSTTLGSISPDVVVSASDGTASATFRPTGQAGLAVVTTRVFGSVPQDQVGNTCSITVTGATDPLLAVSVSSPSQLAGMTIFVSYNPSEVTLDNGGAQPSGAFSSQDCLTLADDDGAGTVQLDIACPTLRTVGGSQVASFDFDNDGFGTIDASDFTVQCNGFDAGGATVPVTCSKSVTQI